MNNSILEVALSYAAKGYYVFPCKPRSKDPATQHGFKDATTDEGQIRRWWAENSEYNIGIPTGKVNGFWALDVDGLEGSHSLNTFRSDIPLDTPQVRTGKGFHLWFAYPEGVEDLKGSAGKVGKGLDIRAEGGYVLAPGSIHPSGARYESSNSYTEPTQAPERLLKALRSKRGAGPLSGPVEEGSRNSTLASIAGGLAWRGVPEDAIRKTLHVMNEDAAVIKQPLPSDEVDTITIYPPSSTPSLRGSDNDDDLPEVKMFRDLTPAKGKRPYIIEGVIFKGHPAALYGDGGTAKSTVAMHMGQCVARGEKWLGHDTVKTPVLYLDFELDQEEQTRRAYEVSAGDGYAEPPEGFYYLPAAGYSTRAMFDHALQVCKDQGTGMVIVDSLGYALSGDAEASRDVLEFFRQVEGSFRRAGITLLIVDHQAKTRQGSSYQDMTMFGSVYKSNSVRSVFQVEPKTHDEGFIDLIVRHKKVNFGPMLNPLGVQVTFDTDKTTVKQRELEASELVEEKLNASDKVLLALEEGPQYPDELAEATGFEVGTVKNALTALRKKGKVEDTGEKRGKAHEVRKVPSSPSLPLRDDANDGSFLAGVA